MCAQFVILCVTIVKLCGRLMGMEISNTEIARCGLCSEGAVRAAKSNGRLDSTDAESVFGFILGMRVKELGLSAFDSITDPIDNLKASGALKRASDKKVIVDMDKMDNPDVLSDPDRIMVPDHSNDETFYENGLYASGSG